MSEFKALENVSDRIQGIIKGAYTRCKNIIKANVKITGGMGKDGNPKDIIGFMEAHGSGKKNRPGSARTFEGMGLALEMLDTLSKVEYVTNQNLEDLDKINEILLAMIRDTTVGKNATNPQNIRFKVVVGFKLNKRTGQPVKIQRDFVYGHFKTPTVLAYLTAKEKYMGSDYDGPQYSESAEQVKYWTSDKPNTSRPPLFIALQKFQAEITKIKDDIEEEPSPGDPIIINIDKGVSLAPFAKINSIKEGFIAILSNDAIYPKKPKDRKGSNKPVWTSNTRPNFRDTVNEYVFSVDETAKKLLDEAVPAWGDEPDDLAVTKIYDSFKIRVNSTRRMKTLARLCLGPDARNIELPGRTSGVVLKGTSPRKDGIIMSGIIKVLSDGEPKTARRIIDEMFDVVNTRYIPTMQQLGNYLAKDPRFKAVRTGYVSGHGIIKTWTLSKDTELQKGKRRMNKTYAMLIDRVLDKATEPISTRQILDLLYDEVDLYDRERQKEQGRRAKLTRRAFPTYNALGQYLRDVANKTGTVRGSNAALWESKNKLTKSSENIEKGKRSRPKESIIQQAFEHRNNQPTSARHLYEIMSSGVIKTLRGTSKKENPFRSVASLVGYMNSYGFKRADVKERSHRSAPSAGGRMYEGVLSRGGNVTLYLPREEE